MFLTQMYGTIIGGFINYAVMISIVTSNRELLVDGNGDSSWSGASSQAFNTNAASWALSPYLYKIGKQYEMVPVGVALGAGAVIFHRIFYQVCIIHQLILNRKLIIISSSPESADLISQRLI